MTKKICCFIIILLTFCITFSVVNNIKITAIQPSKSYPTVKKYNLTDGDFKFVDSRFFVLNDDISKTSLQKIIADTSLISQEFKFKKISSKLLDVVYGDNKFIQSNDIVIQLIKNANYKNEQYQIEIGDHITIKAISTDGLFLGMRCLEKMLILNNNLLKKGIIEDYPDQEFRILHVDMARKHLTKDWIIKQIKDLSYQGFNYIQLHFSENEGFRLQSEVLESKYPGFKYPENGYHTKEDMIEILKMAEKYHIGVIPSFDSPGHSKYILDQIKNLSGKDLSNANLFKDDFRSEQSFNIFDNQEAKVLLRSIFDEYGKFFSSHGVKYMNIGGDEFLSDFSQMTADQYSQVMKHFNDTAKFLKSSYNITSIVWNDGVMLQDFPAEKLNSDIIVEYWGLAARKGNEPNYTNVSAKVEDFIQNGNKLLNFRDNYMYYVLGSWWMQDVNVVAEKIYNEWHPGKFNSFFGQSQDVDFKHPNLLGGGYANWNDSPNMMTEDQISGDSEYYEPAPKGVQKGIYYRTRAVLSRLWHNEENQDYSDLKQDVDKLDRVAGYSRDLGKLPNVKEASSSNVVEDPNKSILDENEMLALSAPVFKSYQPDTNKQLVSIEGFKLVLPNQKEYRNNEDLLVKLELATSELKMRNLIQKDFDKIFSNEDLKSVIKVKLLADDEMPDLNSSKDAYKIVINKDKVEIFARSNVAALYAMRSLGHILSLNNNKLITGTIMDWPDVFERRLHVDMGRKYFSKDWFFQIIREMSYLKLNALQMHFSENLGFRIECDTDPSIVSKQHLTKAEVREIIAEAKKYGIKVIPSLDTPGHVAQILKSHPEFGALNVNGTRNKDALDITNPAAVTYIKKLYNEYMDLFEGSTDFHIGGDEYMEFDRNPFISEYKPILDKYAKTLNPNYIWKDALANYIKDIAEMVNARGFKPRVWNDGLYYDEQEYYEAKQLVEMPSYLGVDFWSQMSWNPSISKLSHIINRGHKDIYNVNATYFYYVLRNGDKPTDGRELHSFDYLNQDRRIYELWRPGDFEGRDNKVKDSEPYIRGVSMAIWSDNPNLVGEDVVSQDISKELRSMATRAWNVNSNNVIDYTDYAKLFDNIGHVPAYDKGAKLLAVSLFPRGERIIISDLEEVEAGYQRLTFDLGQGKFASNNKSKIYIDVEDGVLWNDPMLHDMIARLEKDIVAPEGYKFNNWSQVIKKSDEKVITTKFDAVYQKPAVDNSDVSGNSKLPHVIVDYVTINKKLPETGINR